MTKGERERSSLRLWNGLGGTFLTVAVVAGFHTFSWGLPSLIAWQPDVAGNVMAGTGTVAAIFFGVAQWSATQFHQQSKHTLDTASEGIRRAYAVLEADLPTRNIAWVNAARLVKRSLAVADSITQQEHIDAWKLFRDEWRIRLMKFLDADLSYYFGVEPWKQSELLNVTPALIEDLAKRSETQRVLEIEGLHSTQNDLKMVTGRALKTIYDFVTDYDPADEPLDGVEDFDEEARDNLLSRNHYGALAYTILRDKYTFVGGKAYKNEP